MAATLKKSLQVQILDALHLGEKKTAMNFLQYLGSMHDSLKTEDFLPLLKHCSKVPDPQFTMELWRFMEGKKLNIDRNCYIHILRALSKGGYLDEALNMLKLLGGNSQLKPWLSMYNIFLNGCSENNSLVHASHCLELMENKSIGKSEMTYSELMKMHSLGLEPSLFTYNGFLKAAVLERGVIHGMRVIRAMESRNLKPNNFTYATLSIGYSKSLELDTAEALLDQMADKQPQYRHPFNSLLTACHIVDEPERAVRVLARMKLVGVKPTIKTYELLFSLFGNVNPPYEQGNPQSQEDVLKRISAIEMDMMRNGVDHSQKSMTKVLKALGAEGMVKELLQYLHVAEDRFNGRDTPPLETNVYNIALHGLVEAKEGDVAMQIFEKMKSSGVKSDVATYNIMIDCCSLTGDLQSARRLMATMRDDGFEVHACTYTILMKIMLANEEFEAALNLFNEMKDKGIQSDVVCFNTVLCSASSQGRLDIIEFLVEHMHHEKIQPDPDTCLHVFNAYHAQGFLDTALEALQVLSIRMVSEDETVQREMKSIFQELVIEDSNVEENILEIFKDSREYLATALFNMRLCSFCGVSNSWIPDQSPWAVRLHLKYKQNQLANQ